MIAGMLNIYYNLIVHVVFKDLLLCSLESFAGKTKEIDDLDQSMLGELTKVEQYLLKTQEMMIVRGKVSVIVFMLYAFGGIKIFFTSRKDLSKSILIFH
jgi:hypothetical protein